MAKVTEIERFYTSHTSLAALRSDAVVALEVADDSPVVVCDAVGMAFLRGGRFTRCRRRRDIIRRHHW